MNGPFNLVFGTADGNAIDRERGIFARTLGGGIFAKGPCYRCRGVLAGIYKAEAFNRSIRTCSLGAERQAVAFPIVDDGGVNTGILVGVNGVTNGFQAAVGGNGNIDRIRAAKIEPYGRGPL